MQLPFMMLSYGDFSITKKLFWYERDGLSLLPIFTDSEIAFKFIDEMQKILDDNGYDVKLQAQVCDGTKNAIAIFTTITTVLPSLQTIVLNPAMDGVDNNATDIGTILNSLQSDLSDFGNIPCDSEKHL